MSHALSEWLKHRAPRERRLLVLAFAFALLALFWWLAVAPALQTHQASAAAHAKLDRELTSMQAMAAQVRQIQAMPTTSARDAQTWLASSVKKLGKATLTIQGTRAQINFASASPEALATWLTEARTQAQLLPVQANWRRVPSVGNSPAGNNADALWDGAIMLELPAK